MACGTPVLAFARGAVGEIVQDGVSGWQCEDAADMARRIASLGVKPSSCREWAADRFSSRRMAADYVAIYERVLAGATANAAEA